jgi:uncharacterized RDD family membrane protein YckC
MFCKKCGKELPETAQFCDSCGEKVEERKLPASMLIRFANYFIDGVAAWIIAMVILILGTFLHSIILQVLAYTFFLWYYIIFESIWQTTFGKLATKTKVVNYQGNKAGFWRIVGRTLCRLIPFDRFSYLFSSYPMGWHDRISKTLVVPKNFTPEDVQKMDLSEIRKTKAVHAVAVVVIIIVIALYIMAVVGILASIVLTSLTVARGKGQDAMITQTFKSLSDETQMFVTATKADGNQPTFSGFCADSATVNFMNSIPKVSDSGPFPRCNDSQESYAISAPLNSGKYACTDSTGANVLIDANLFDGQTVCPPASVNSEEANKALDSFNQ